MNNLALVYEQQGKYTEAEVLHQQTLELERTALGDAHPSTLDSMNNLALVYQQQGKYAEAEALRQQVLVTRDVEVDPDRVIKKVVGEGQSLLEVDSLQPRLVSQKRKRIAKGL